MSNKLDRIESNLRALFEEKLFRMFTGGQQSTDLIRDLLQILRNKQKEEINGSVFIPDLIQVHVPETDLEEWLIHQDTLDSITASIHKSFQQEGFLFHAPMHMAIKGSQAIANKKYQITAHFSENQVALPDTSAIESPRQNGEVDQIPTNACFVIGGKQNFSLNKSVMDIGRHSDCDLILDDLHISRHHAQLRVINDQFVIFDTGSTAGVLLNGKKVSQASLQSGDVVRIGLVNLIYIQDTTSENPTTALPTDIDASQFANGDQK